MGSPTAPSAYAVTTPRQSPRAPSKFTAGALVAGRYRLIRYLARGGMAEVWLATHESLRSEVAIKFIDQILAQDNVGAVERFRLEAQISARLGARTKHIVAVHDAGEHEGVPFLVMEFVEGRTLERELEGKGTLDLSLCADLLDQAADALSIAHELGVVHRDLKPSNLMLIDEPDGSVVLKVTDFGIAKALRKDVPLDRPKETRLGEMVGSPAYMSPEQIDGVGDIDARSDLWSLGVVVYEALTGRPCFEQGALTELVIAIGTAKYKPASRLRPELPEAVDAWLARAIAVKPENRFSSAAEMAESFRATIARPRARRRAVWGLAAGALVIAAGVSVALLASRSPKAEPARPAVAASNDGIPSAVVPTSPPPPRAPSSVVAASSVVEPPSAAPPRVQPSPSTKPTAAPSVSPSVSPTPTVTPTPTAPVSVPPPKKRIDPSEVQ